MLFVLDTNVVSEMMSQTPDEAVLKWFAGHKSDEFVTTAISQTEIFSGANRLPEGKKKLALLAAAEMIFDNDFVGGIYAFDTPAALQAASILAERAKLGLPISFQDACIAAIAKVRNAAVLTRDTSGFIKTGVKVVNPWVDT